MMISLRLTWQERAQLEVISHPRLLECAVSVVYVYSYVLRLS
jgi:hypothetical protein